MNRISFADFQLASLIFDSLLQEGWFNEREEEEEEEEEKTVIEKVLLLAKNNKTDTKTGEYGVLAQTLISQNRNKRYYKKT